MVTVLDTKLAPKVLAIIAKYGKTVSWSVTSGATHTPSTGAVTGGTTTAHTVKVTPPEPYESKYVDGDVVREGDSRIYIAASGLAFTPAENQRVTIDAAVWTVTRVNAIYSGDLVCLWEAGLRR